MRWQDGCPCDTGSTDGQDSARLAGLMKLFNHSHADKFDLTMYCGFGDYFRHPIEGNKYPYSRDQATCYFAGLYAAHDMQYVDATFKPQNDFISPSVRGHFKRCAGRPDTWLERTWLYLDVIYSAFVAPLDEPNQLICMLMIADVKYLKLWCRLNKSWEWSILLYWCEGDGVWRQEPELAELMIKIINEKIKM